jgi:hypothetical protein
LLRSTDERDQAQLLEDLEGEAGVGAVVFDEPGAVFLEEAQDLARLVLARERLAFPRTERATASRP